jgi:phosphatidylserine decarboxylase
MPQVQASLHQTWLKWFPNLEVNYFFHNKIVPQTRFKCPQNDYLVKNEANIFELPSNNGTMQVKPLTTSILNINIQDQSLLPL